MLKLFVVLLLIVEGVAGTDFERGSCKTSGFFSEEGDGGYYGNFKKPFSEEEVPLNGMACKEDNKHCDDLTVEACESYQYRDSKKKLHEISLTGADCEWGDEFIDGVSKTSHECPLGQFVSAISCDGPYCGNVRVRCCTPGLGWKLNAPAAISDLKEMTYISENGYTARRAGASWDKTTQIWGSAPVTSYTKWGALTRCPVGMVVAAVGGKWQRDESNKERYHERFVTKLRIVCVKFDVTILEEPLSTDKVSFQWAAICSSTASSKCSASMVRSTSLSTSNSNSKNFAAAFSIGLEAKAEVKPPIGPASGISVSAAYSYSLSTGLSQSVATSTDSTQSCTADVTLPPNCANNTNIVVWQFNGQVPTAGATTTVKTCWTAATTSFKMHPKCLPGDCKDCDCQTCVNPANYVQ